MLLKSIIIATQTQLLGDSGRLFSLEPPQKTGIDIKSNLAMPHLEVLKDSMFRSTEHGDFHKWLHSPNAYSIKEILFYSPYLNHQPLSSIHYGNMKTKIYIPSACCDINLLKATLNDSCYVKVLFMQLFYLLFHLRLP